VLSKKSLTHASGELELPKHFRFEMKDFSWMIEKNQRMLEQYPPELSVSDAPILKPSDKHRQ
jgi:hypothetical protein